MASITAWAKKVWKDRKTEYPTRRTLTKTNGSQEIVTVTRNEGSVSQEGDAFSAENMNNLEERIDAGFTEVKGKLTWKRIGSKSIIGAGSVTIPTNASEIIIKANLGYNIIIDIPIPVAFLMTTEQSYRGGYYQNGSNGAMADFKCTTSKITLNNAFLNANSVLPTTEWAVWYR